MGATLWKNNQSRGQGAFTYTQILPSMSVVVRMYVVSQVCFCGLGFLLLWFLYVFRECVFLSCVLILCSAWLALYVISCLSISSSACCSRRVMVLTPGPKSLWLLLCHRFVFLLPVYCFRYKSLWCYTPNLVDFYLPTDEVTSPTYPDRVLLD